LAKGERPHFQIPEERVYFDAVVKTGFGTTFEREDYRAHGEFLVRRTQEFRRDTARQRDSNLTAVKFLQVKTPEGVPIKSERPRLRSIGIDVVSFSKTDPTAGIARIESERLDDIEGRLLEYARTPDHRGRTYFAGIEDISEIPPQEKIDQALLTASVEMPVSDPADCIVYVQATLSEREQDAILEAVRAFTLEADGDFLASHRFRAGFATARVRIRVDRLEALGQSFNTVREIRPNRAFFVEDSVPIGRLPDSIRVASPRVSTGVAIVDSGIQPRCAAVSPLVRGSIVSLPPTAVAPRFDHGTFVASRVLYGDSLEVQLARGMLEPSCWLVDVPVFGVTTSGADATIDDHHLAVALDTALPQLPPDVRTVNLSLGTDEPIKDHEYSLVATTLDHLARELNLLIVTTSGNVRDRGLVAAYPASVQDPRWRIDPPGEALLALTVGSIAHHGDNSTQAAPRQLSPFSRVGPGADGGRKPEVVAHGGNYVAPGHPVSRYGVHGVFSDGKQLAWDNGTSFAAPLVAGIAAELFQAYPGADASLIKALLCHFTTPALPPVGEMDSYRCVGLGEPDATAAIDAGPCSGSFVYVGSMTAERYKFLPFWVPRAFADGANGRLRIRCTVVWDPPTNPTNSVEYSKTRISVGLRKPAEVGHAEIQLSGCTPSYHQWNPLIHFDKVFHRQYNTGEWELRLRLWTRDLPDDFEQRFAAIIEVRDEGGGIDVWREIKADGLEYSAVALNVAA
jgi:hypothetical protein